MKTPTTFLTLTTKINNPVHGEFQCSAILQTSARPCGKTAAQNSMIPITPLLQQPILMQRSLTAMPTPKIFLPPTASCSIALSRRSSTPNALLKPHYFTAYAAHITAFFQSALNGSILYVTSLTCQFPTLHPLTLTFMFHKLHSQIPRRSCPCQNGPGPGRVNSLISNEVWRTIDFHQ